MSDIIEIFHFFSPAECKAYRALLHETTEAVPFTASSDFDNKKWRNPALTSQWFERLQRQLGRPDLLRANDIVLGATYKVGQSFGMHTDTGLYYSEARQEKSRWTLLVYLNDGPGGETIFFDDAWTEIRRIAPVMGKALLFDIELWHRGAPVGFEKAFIGTEIIGPMKSLAQ